MVFFRRSVESKGRTPGGQQDRFPGYDVLGQVWNWDAVTAGVVLRRLGPPPDLRFFTLDEQAIGGCLFDQLLDQQGEPRVPVLELVDARLLAGETDGWHYEDMPEDGEAFRQTFAALDEDARSGYGARFCELDWYDQADVIEAVKDAGTSGEKWREFPAKHVWSLWTRYACAAFYSHPFAWNEIGFGGPAYPRGYKNLGIDAWESWEVPDHSDISPVGFGDQVDEARERRRQVRERQRAREGERPA